ncbi:MAG: 50S ribosomal protein L17 [Candidatus Pacearchaeota archaeon]
MKKNIFGRKLKRDTKERKALFKSLLTSLVLKERIKTTEAKAKAIKSEADKLISKARKGKLLAQRLLSVYLHPKAIEKMISDIAPRFENRKGGYTRIIKLGERLSDNARMVIMEWVEKKEAIEPKLDEFGEPSPKVSEGKRKTVKEEKTKKNKAAKKRIVAKKENKKIVKPRLKKSK